MGPPPHLQNCIFSYFVGFARLLKGSWDTPTPWAPRPPFPFQEDSASFTNIPAVSGQRREESRWGSWVGSGLTRDEVPNSIGKWLGVVGLLGNPLDTGQMVAGRSLIERQSAHPARAHSQEQIGKLRPRAGEEGSQASLLRDC